jgi:hypothetical protein
MEALNEVNAEIVRHLPLFSCTSTTSLAVLGDLTESQQATTPTDSVASLLIENRLSVGDMFSWDKNRLAGAETALVKANTL